MKNTRIIIIMRVNLRSGIHDWYRVSHFHYLLIIIITQKIEMKKSNMQFGFAVRVQVIFVLA